MPTDFNYGNNQRSYSHVNESSIDILASSTTVIEENINRKYLILQNVSNADIWISFSEANLGKTLLITPGGSYEVYNGSSSLWTGSVYAYCASGPKKMNYLEGS